MNTNSHQRTNNHHVSKEDGLDTDKVKDADRSYANQFGLNRPQEDAQLLAADMEKVMHVTEYKYLPLLPENMCKKLRIKG
jgi:hypothetical protein